MQSANYMELANALVEDIRAGRLQPGERLPPQRQFAHARGIAVSTAQRVYAELERRGVVSGEVGRGTFVRLAARAGTLALGAPASLPIDLHLNFPTVPGQQALLAASLAGLLRRADAAAFAPASPQGTPELRSVAAAFFAPAHTAPLPAGSLLFAGNGKQAIAAAIAATVRRGEVLGVEALTYPFLKSSAQQLGIRLLPLPVDEEGIVPAALTKAKREASLSAVYLQPVLHNPLGITMSAARHAALAAILIKHEIIAIEDAIYAFLDVNAARLRAAAPDHVVLVDSLSKSLAPGLTLGVIAAPPQLREGMERALYTGGWVAPSFAQAACARWMADGTAATIIAAKRQDGAARQQLAQRALGRFGLRGAPHAYHCWLPLPAPWRADTFLAAAARHNIAVTPASAFAAAPGHVPNAVRLALAAPPMDVLSEALNKLASLLDGGSEASLPVD